MNLEDIMLSKISWMGLNKYNMISLVFGIQKQNTQQNNNSFINTENKLMVAKRRRWK